MLITKPGYALKEATTKAEAWVAIPGTSEHQLGLGVDINKDGIHSTGEDVYEWLNQNSYKFGFIRRYPADKTDITELIMNLGTIVTLELKRLLKYKIKVFTLKNISIRYIIELI